MNNLLSEKLGSHFFTIPESQIIDSWLQLLEDAVTNKTIQNEYQNILFQVLNTKSPNTKWQGLSLFIMVLGDSHLWKELFYIIKLMREFIEHEQLNPNQPLIGTWNHALYNLVSLFKIETSDDITIAEILIGEVAFFTIDSYKLIQRIATYYFNKQNEIKYKEWNTKALELELVLIKKQGITHEQLTELYLR